MCFLAAVFILVYAIVFAVTSVRSSRVLHSQMLYNVLRSPMMFFETTPVGRILNRFSRDIETIDNVLPNLVRSWLSTFFTAISTVVIISYSTPIFLSVVVPLFVVYYFIQVQLNRGWPSFIVRAMISTLHLAILQIILTKINWTTLHYGLIWATLIWFSKNFFLATLFGNSFYAV